VEKPEAFTLLMEYVENGDLFHKMRRRRLNRKEVIFAAGELILALNYLHK